MNGMSVEYIREIKIGEVIEDIIQTQHQQEITKIHKAIKQMRLPYGVTLRELTKGASLPE
jgi:hypothetical protein